MLNYLATLVRRRSLASFLAVLASLLTITVASAIANPDEMQLISIRAYESVIETDDMLFVVYYTIDYTSIPSERASEAFLIRFIEGSTELKSATPFAFVNSGYSDGVVSIYFNSAEVATFGLIWENPYTIRLQGSPSLFAVPPVVNSGSIDWTSQLVTKTRFREHTLESARDLEVTWADFTDPDIELVQETPEGTTFTAEGEDYFTNVIANLRVIAPPLFSGRVVTPNFTERTFDTSYSEQLQNFWDGTSFGQNFQTWADLLSVDRLLFTTFLLVLFNLFIAYVAFLVLRSTDFTPLTVAVIFPVGAYIGMTDMILAALMAAAAVIGSVYILYLRRA